MSFKRVVLCAQICLIKTVFTQFLGPRSGLMGDGFGPRPALMAEGLGAIGAPCGRFESSLLLENYPMPTPGLSIMADDLLIEGLVSVSGSLPFLGTVAIEGVLPTEGQGSVLYGCGNGDVRILSDNKGPYGPMGGPVGGPYAGPMPGPFPGPMAPGPVPRSPAFGPLGSPGNLGPVMDPGMAARSAGQAAKMTSLALGAANAALPAIAGL